VTSRNLTAPSDLAARGRGRRFWKQVTMEWECGPVELELLAEACRVLDELDALRRAVKKEGATVRGSEGQRRAHPALAEARLLRGELRRLLDALAIPAPLAAAAEQPGVVSMASRRAQKAARARWDNRGRADA
jgi:hypothetical protein